MSCRLFPVICATGMALAPVYAHADKAKDGAKDLRFSIPPYLQDASVDGIVVAWETDTPTAGVVRLDLPGRRTAFLSPPGTRHEVRLLGLRPGTRYRYVVAIREAKEAKEAKGAKPKEVVSPPAEFTTAPASGPFTFLVYGDNRDRDADHAAVIRAMAPEAPDFVIQTGDMVGNANEDHLWRRFFATASPVMRTSPMYPALGNHEIHGDPEANHFYRYFVLPGGEDRSRKAIYYSFHYGNSLFVALDGNVPYDVQQGQWMERTLKEGSANPKVRHIFVFVHQPPYAVGAYCGSEREQRRFVPFFRKHRVRAVFGGHEHAYIHLERDGVRYFVSGGGGAPLYPRTQPCNEEDQKALRLFRAEHHYLRVRVRGDEAELTAVDKNGQVMDYVKLHQPVPEPVAEKPKTKPRPQILGRPIPKEALPISIGAGALAGSAFLLAFRRRPRRRKDLLPGGEPPPRLRR